MTIPAASTFTGPQFYDAFLGPHVFGPQAYSLAQQLPADPGGDVLELACGTGLVTTLLRERLARDHALVATDLSKNMLDYARAKHAQVQGIAWREADAMQLPFEDARFAGVVSGFGLMFMPDKAAALREARRVLAPGGWLLASVWDRIEENPHNLVNAMVVEAMFPGDPEVRFRLPYEMHDRAALQALLQEAGFTDVQISTQRHAIEGADPAQLAAGQVRGTPRSALLEKKGASLDDVIAKVAAALAAQGGNAYRGQTQALIAVARAA